jgi:nucleoside-diphosphate-sugar epimerase
MKILLLGAGGFIGANLAECLVNDRKHEITALDIEREKLDETVKSGEINYIHFDIREKLANKMCATFDKHFRQPGDPYPEIISVPSEEFYGKGYEDCDRRIPDVTKARKLVDWRSKHDLDSVLYHTMKYFVEKHRTKQPVAA